MVILIIMGGFFPGKKYGGPPVSVDNFCSLIKIHDCYVVTRDHDLNDSIRYNNVLDGWNDRGNCKVKYLSDSQFSLKGFEQIIKELKPDLIYLQGFFQQCIFPCLLLAKRLNISVLLAPRGELCSGALNIKKYKKIPYIYLFRFLGFDKIVNWQSTSDEETEAIKKWIKANNRHIFLTENIPSIPKLLYSRKIKIPGQAEFIFLSRIHQKKNLLAAIEYLKYASGKIRFDIYGSIEDEDYWMRCQEEIRKLPQNIIVEYKGLVNHEQVHEVFSQYDAFIFPTMSENYGHVIIESLIVGTPVIISNNTPWKRLEENGAGWDLSIDDHQSYIDAINQIIIEDNEQSRIRSARAKEYAETNSKVGQLKEQYIEMLEKVAINREGINDT